MKQARNRLPQWLKSTLLISGALLLLSGAGWLVAHYFYGAASAEGELPHAAEAPLIRLHGLAMIVFLFALGGLAPVHMPRGWRQNHSVKSGITLVICAVLLAASGYALYYWISEDLHALLGLAHSAAGAIMALVFALHWQLRSKH